MNKWKNLLIAISSNRIWFITFMCLDLFFIFLAWLAYPEYFTSYVALIIFVSLAALTIPITISIKKSNKADVVFHRFLLEPDDTNEYLLCEIVPALLRPYVRELGQHLRTQQEYVNEQKIKISDYEQYIENWAHEIKKPLSLMTLLLDNRKNEMSPLVHTRMLYVRDHARQDVEQILYFSRLGTVHKDYYFEPLSILRTCREAVGYASYGDMEYVPHVLRYYVMNEETSVSNESAKTILEELKKNNTAPAEAWDVIEKGASLIGSVQYSMEKRQADGRDKPEFLDCSSFSAWAFHKAGVTSVPYGSTTATFIDSKRFHDISADQLQPGDIGLKSRTGETGGANHVGIYCGKR